MLKPFKELYRIDISGHVQKKPTFKKGQDGRLQKCHESQWLDYLEWGTCLTLLYEHGAESVTFGNTLNADGYPAHYNGGANPFVRVWVHIDGNEYHIDYPVINGNAVLANPNQMDIHRATVRAFVKCVAINTGLGLSLWQKEETMPMAEPDPEVVKLPELLPGTDKWKQAIEALKKGYTIEQIQQKYSISETNLKTLQNAV